MQWKPFTAGDLDLHSRFQYSNTWMCELTLAPVWLLYELHPWWHCITPRQTLNYNSIPFACMQDIVFAVYSTISIHIKLLISSNRNIEKEGKKANDVLAVGSIRPVKWLGTEHITLFSRQRGRKSIFNCFVVDCIVLNCYSAKTIFHWHFVSLAKDCRQWLYVGWGYAGLQPTTCTLTQPTRWCGQRHSHPTGACDHEDKWIYRPYKFLVRQLQFCRYILWCLEFQCQQFRNVHEKPPGDDYFWLHILVMSGGWVWFVLDLQSSFLSMQGLGIYSLLHSSIDQANFLPRMGIHSFSGYLAVIHSHFSRYWTAVATRRTLIWDTNVYNCCNSVFARRTEQLE